ncbi:hypothetical protein C8F04DRAFT_1344284 [Mycena alexandri]|uniref:Uncharacterized protein n=1 Tax=Mycena alexandri TaxID=1745969 RepID=A0AAD6SX35_9AGAR|nr:hypothetical protein C8F04DRAFT_1344284 [Mycena alexandri]
MMWLSTLLWLSRLLCTTSAEAHERAQRKGAAPGAQYHDPYPEVPEEPLRKIALYSLSRRSDQLVVIPEPRRAHSSTTASGILKRCEAGGSGGAFVEVDPNPHGGGGAPSLRNPLCSCGRLVHRSSGIYPILPGVAMSTRFPPSMTNLRLAVTRDMDYRDAARKFKLCIEIAPGYETEGTRSIDLWQGKFGSVNASIAPLGSTWIIIGLVQIGTSRIQILCALRWGETVGGNISPPFVLMLAVCITA